MKNLQTRCVLLESNGRISTVIVFEVMGKWKVDIVGIVVTLNKNIMLCLLVNMFFFLNLTKIQYEQCYCRKI